MPKEKGFAEAIRLAVESLWQVDLPARCADLDLSEPLDGFIRLRAFGEDMELRQSDFQLFAVGSEVPVEPGDRILLLHYLLCDLPLGITGELISFRELTGGQFFWGPFRARSVEPLLRKFGSDLELLRNNLDRLDWQAVSMGDVGARIHVFGKVHLTLVYRAGDEELPPAADLLFDACIKRVYEAEDAAVLAGRICRTLL